MKILTRILVSLLLILAAVSNIHAQDLFWKAPVGIGTVNPAQALDIHGNVKFSGAGMPNNLPGSTGNILLSAGAGAAPTWFANGTSGQVLTSTGSGVGYSTVGFWSLTGNAGTVPGINYVGTTDDQQLRFIVDITNQTGYSGNGDAGSLDPQFVGATTYGNTYLGTPNPNNSVGGAGNTDAGTYNVAMGFGSLGNNTTGTQNVMLGYQTDGDNSSGSNNVAIGLQAMCFSNSTGSGEVGVGYSALLGNGTDNTAVVTATTSISLTGAYSSALGYQALYATNAAGSNTAMGSFSERSTTHGKNTAAGDSALYTNSTGAPNTALGYYANVSNGTINNTVAIGAKAAATVNNTLILGSINGVNSGTSNVTVGIGTTTPAQELEIAPSSRTVRVDGIGNGHTYSASTSLTTDQIVYAKASGDLYSMPNTTAGYALTLTGGVPTWAALVFPYTVVSPLSISGSVISLTGGASPYYGVLSGTGTGASYTPYGTVNYILQSQGGSGVPVWVSYSGSGAGSDNWGTQSVVTDSSNNILGNQNTITGNGTLAYPLKLSKQNASIGQTLLWNGSTWKPGAASYITQNLNGNGSSVVVSNGNGQLVGSTGSNLDIRGTAGAVLIGTGSGTSAVFNSAGSGFLTSNGTGIPTWTAADWNLNGNTIGNYGLNFLGTTNTSGNEPLEFYVNNAYAGVFDATNSNVFLGRGTGGDSTALIASTKNVAIGTAALRAPATTTTNTVAIGVSSANAYKATTLGSVGVGSGAMHGATTGTPYTAFGQKAAFSNTTGSYITAIGYAADYSNNAAVAFHNVAVGDSALYSASSGTTFNGNTAVGVKALFTNNTGGANTAFGRNAAALGTTNNANTAFGYHALYDNGVGRGNAVIGANAMSLEPSNGENVAIGSRAAYEAELATAANGPLVAIGDSTLISSLEPWKTVAIGYMALKSFSSNGASSNTAIGYQAMQANTSGLSTTAIGSQAYAKYTTSGFSTFIGAGTAEGTTLGSEEIAIGAGAMGSSNVAESGTFNIAIGSTNSIVANPIGTNTSLANATLGSLTSGIYNIAIGYNTANALSTAQYSVLIGNNAASTFNISGAGLYNVAIGANTLLPSTLTNYYNIAVGYGANAANGSLATNENFYNVALGGNATAGVSTVAALYAFYNVALGSGANASAPAQNSQNVLFAGVAIGAGAVATATNAIAIGANAYAPNPNTAILGSIAGVNGGTANVSVGVNISNPNQALEVSAGSVTTGTIRVDGLGTNSGGAFENTAPSLTTDQMVFGRSTGDLYSVPTGSTTGMNMVLSATGVPTWGYPPLGVTATPVLYNTGSSTLANIVAEGTYGAVLYGTGTSAVTGTNPGAAFTSLTGQGVSQAYGSVDSILGWSSTYSQPVWVNANASAGVNDNWGTQFAVTDSDLTSGVKNTITGNGLPGAPLKLSKNGAVTTPYESALGWTGSTWAPSSGNASLAKNNIVPAGSSIVKITNQTNQVVGGSNVTLDIQGTAGGILVGNGIGSSATFAVGTAGQYLMSNGPGLAPTYQNGTPQVWNFNPGGNAGTTISDYLGTADDEPLQFHVTGQGGSYNGPAGSLDPQFIGATPHANVYLGGPNTNNSNTNGAGNLDQGSYNVGFGFGTMGFASGAATYNVAMGMHCLEAINGGTMSSSYDVAMGVSTMVNNSNGGSDITIIGGNAGGGFSSTTTSNYNTGLGWQTFYGQQANGVYYGSYSTAAGYNSMYGATASTSSSNTGIGTYTLYQTAASQNTAIGDSSLYSNSTGTDNAALGYDADNSGILTNATSVGAYSYASTSNTLVLGQISGVANSTVNTNVGIGTNTPRADAALAIKDNHIETQGQVMAGNVYADAGAGSANGGTATITTSATDVGGSITLTTGTGGLASGAQATVLFGNPYAFPPIIVLTPANSAAASAMTAKGAYATSSTGAFSINFSTAPAASTIYKFNYFALETPGTTSVSQPSEPNPCDIPITLTNTQSIPTISGFQEKIVVNSSSYAADGENATLNNVEFSTGPQGGGTVLQTWIESGASNASTSTIYWINLGSNIIPANGILTIYMNFMGVSVFSATGPTGEAPQLSGTYAQYDNGSLVFPSLYNNFAGTTISGSWNQVTNSGYTTTQNNGITCTTNASANYGGIVWTPGYSNSPNVQVFDADVTAVSGVAAGIALQVDATGGSGYNNGYDFSYWGSNPYTDGGSSVAYGAIINGENVGMVPNLTLLTGIMGGAWVGGASVVTAWYSNYAVTTSSAVEATFPTTVYPSIGEYCCSSSSSVTVQWMRTHYYAPNGVMPSASFGGISCCAAPPALGGSIAGASTFCPNSSGNAYSVTPVAGVTSYTWTAPAGSTITGQGSSSVTITFGTVLGNITVSPTNGCGGEGSPLTLAVSPTFTITGQPANSSYSCPGTNPSFTVTATGAVASYAWQVSTNGGVSWSTVSNGGVYLGAITATLNISGPPTTMNGYEYRAVVTGTGCATALTSNAATLFVGTVGVQSVPITFTNSQTTATPTGFQVKLSPVNFFSYIGNGELTNLTNIEFSTGPAASGTPLYAWIENGSAAVPATVPTSSSTAAIVWVNLGSSSIPASGTLTIYMNFMPSAVMGVPTGATSLTGEAPQFTGTYAQYDNGSQVFPSLYTNFAGNTVSASWNQIVPSGYTTTQNNSVTLTTTGSSNYGGLGWSPGYANSPNVQVFDGDVTAVSGVAAGMGLQIDATGGSAGYNNGYDFTFWEGGSVSLGSMINGENSPQNTPSAQLVTGVMGGALTSSTTQVWYINYAATAGTQSALALPSTVYPALGMYFNSPSSSITYQWVRTHYYAPNGVMPTAAFGSGGCH